MRLAAQRARPKPDVRARLRRRARAPRARRPRGAPRDAAAAPRPRRAHKARPGGAAAVDPRAPRGRTAARAPARARARRVGPRLRGADLRQGRFLPAHKAPRPLVHDEGGGRPRGSAERALRLLGVDRGPPRLQRTSKTAHLRHQQTSRLRAMRRVNAQHVLRRREHVVVGVGLRQGRGRLGAVSEPVRDGLLPRHAQQAQHAGLERSQVVHGVRVWELRPHPRVRGGEAGAGPRGRGLHERRLQARRDLHGALPGAAAVVRGPRRGLQQRPPRGRGRRRRDRPL
mmetsp:Transcript_31205/g.93595  ORF Transcript_31205/g.93595 Transcript_31205/m.93595 type:complete len:285 (+) Transcript_31205:204-1058(+)